MFKSWKRMNIEQKMNRLWFLFKAMMIILLIKGILDLVQLVGYIYYYGLFQIYPLT